MRSTEYGDHFPYIVAAIERDVTCANQSGGRCLCVSEREMVWVVEFNGEQVSPEFLSSYAAEVYAYRSHDLWQATREEFPMVVTVRGEPFQFNRF